MKTYKLAALLLGAALFTGIGATSAMAKCDGEKQAAPASTKCGSKKDMNKTKCGGEKAAPVPAPKGKCGKGKCGS